MWDFRSGVDVGSFGDEVDKAIAAFFARTDLGFFREDLISESRMQCEAHRTFFEGKEALVVIGLGGSSLGTRAMSQALFPGKLDRLHFLDNVDAFTLDAWIDSVESPEKLGWFVCSKSGGTIEVTSLFDYCHQEFKKKHNISILENTAVATESKDSLLKNLADQHQLPCLEIPLDVGGRFSAFTPVGLFPLSFLGLNFSLLEKGFSQSLLDHSLLQKMASQLWASHKRGEHSLYSFQYCDRLHDWGLWLQQLWSESLAKKISRDGQPAAAVATIVPCRGASDQHSVLQQVIEGNEKKFVCFHQVASSERSRVNIESSLFETSLLVGSGVGRLLQVQAEATEQAIRESQSGTMVLKTSELNEESLACLMMAWMLCIGVLGELLNIDAFNQPGVESGKVITRRVLSQPR